MVKLRENVRHNFVVELAVDGVECVFVILSEVISLCCGTAWLCWIVVSSSDDDLNVYRLEQTTLGFLAFVIGVLYERNDGFVAFLVVSFSMLQQVLSSM